MQQVKRRIRKPLKGKAGSKKSKANAGETVIETELIYFKKTGAYIMKAGGQILRYQDSGQMPFTTIKYVQADTLECLLEDYYGMD